MSKIRWLGLTVFSCFVLACSEADEPSTGDDGGASGSSPGGASTGGTSAGGTSAGGTSAGGTPAGGPSSSGGGGTAGASPTGGTLASTGGVSAGGASQSVGGKSSGGSSAGGGTTSGAGGMLSTPGGGSSGGGRGGRSSGGRASSTGGIVGSTSENCSLLMDGATGNEEDGQMPVCCTPSSAEATLIEEVFTLLNEHRMANGESALAYDDELQAAIQGHCLHMSQHSFFQHEAPEQSIRLPWDRAELCGTSANGENIAQGQRTPEDVMEGWIESSGHNENMLNSRFTRVGIGYVAAGRYWGQIFGN